MNVILMGFLWDVFLLWYTCNAFDYCLVGVFLKLLLIGLMEGDLSCKVPACVFDGVEMMNSSSHG